MTTIKPLAVATSVCLLLVPADLARAQGPVQGRSQVMTPEARRADCRAQASRRGLVGQSNRSERQAFMQKCVHGPA